MGGNEFIESAKNAIMMYLKDPKLGPMDIQVVWMCKTLQNAKGLFFVSSNNELYFEITYNGDLEEFYMDVYKNIDNVVIVKADNVGDIIEEG